MTKSKKKYNFEIKLTWQRQKARTTITVNTQQTTGGHCACGPQECVLLAIEFDWQGDTHSHRVHRLVESCPDPERKCKTMANKRPESDCNKLVNEKVMDIRVFDV